MNIELRLIIKWALIIVIGLLVHYLKSLGLTLAECAIIMLIATISFIIGLIEK